MAALLAGVVGPEMCGSTVTSGWRHRGDSAGSGSTSNTSSTACESRPPSRAASRASVATIGPRPKLISAAPGFIVDSRPASRRPRVSSVSGSRQTATSLDASRPASPSGPEKPVTPGGAALGERLQAATLNPAPTSRSAAALPSVPRPRIPIVVSPGGR